jgi:hypothetical protein
MRFRWITNKEIRRSPTIWSWRRVYRRIAWYQRVCIKMACMADSFIVVRYITDKDTLSPSNHTEVSRDVRTHGVSDRDARQIRGSIHNFQRI